MTVSWDNLNIALEEPEQWWGLNVVEDKIVTASIWGKITNYLLSFLSSSLLENLQKVYSSSIEEIDISSELNESQKITVEKTSTLLQNNHCWFHSRGSLPDLERWNFLSLKVERTDLVQPHKERGIYLNSPKDDYWGHFKQGFSHMFEGIFEPATRMDLSELVVREQPVARSEDLRIQWVGHASCLIQVASMNILTDPVYGFVAPIYRRHTEPGIKLKDLPHIDTILISHAHKDHLDEKTLLALRKYQPQILVPEGLKGWFEERGFTNVQEHSWWDEGHAFQSSKKVQFTCVPAKHWCQRSLSDGNKYLWSGWMIEARGQLVYFAGDTAADEAFFSDIKKRFPHIDVALLPIGPENHHYAHLDLEQSLDAMKQLDAGMMIPIHWGAYRTGVETVESPYLKMQQMAKENPEFAEKVCYLKIGESFSQKKEAVSKTA